MPLRPLAIRPQMDNLQINDEGRQVLLVQQPSHAQNILLPSAQVQHLPNQVTATTQQQIQGGGLWFGATQYNGMYFQSNQTMAQAMLPINAAPPRYVSPIYTQAQIGNGNYAPLEMNPTTALFPRQNYVMHPSSFIPSNDSMLATGTPHLHPAHCGVMLHGRSNLGMPRVDSRTMDSFYVQDKMSTGLFDSNILGPTNVFPGRHGTFQDLLRSGSSRTAVESILTEGMNMLPEKNPNGYRPSSTYQISNKDLGAFDIAAKCIKKAQKKLREYYMAKENAKCTQATNRVAMQSNYYTTDSDTGIDSGSEKEVGHGNSYGAAGSSAMMSDSELLKLRAPAFKRPSGRPIQIRRKSSQEINGKKRKRKIDNDFAIGTGAPVINTEEPSQKKKKIRCGECQLLGHNATNCRKKLVDLNTEIPEF